MCGGGLDSEGRLPPWVARRFDRAMEIAAGGKIIALSAGSPHKASTAVESVVGAEYLLARGYPRESMLREASSYDTIGNAYFARVIHTDPAGFRKLCVITSDFHMPRTEAIFRWIFGADAAGYELTFEATASGLHEEPFRKRVAREQQSLDLLAPRFSELKTMNAIHKWLFSEHEIYSAGLAPARTVDEDILSTY